MMGRQQDLTKPFQPCLTVILPGTNRQPNGPQILDEPFVKLHPQMISPICQYFISHLGADVSYTNLEVTLEPERLLCQGTSETEFVCLTILCSNGVNVLTKAVLERDQLWGEALYQSGT